MRVSQPVDFDPKPYGGRLHAWGRTDQFWWGLVSWRQNITFGVPAERAVLLIAAWMPARQLRQPYWARDQQQPGLPRYRLPADRDQWPRPVPESWDGWYGGIWETGLPPVPDGCIARY